VVEAPWGLRYNDPGSKYRHKSADGTWWFRINRQGMRDNRDFSYKKPDGVKRIISLGDSFTIGYQVDVDQTFSAVLERELQKAGHDVEVLNAGVSGFSNAEEALYLERELLKYDPDLVVLSFYSNDLTDNVRTGLFRLKDGNLHPRWCAPTNRLFVTTSRRKPRETEATTLPKALRNCLRNNATRSASWLMPSFNGPTNNSGSAQFLS
jgi:hypothetical protein